MPRFSIENIEDPRLEPFRGIRNRNWTELSGLFIAEGPLLVELLLASDYRCHSVLLDRKYLDHYAAMIGPDVDVLEVEHALVEQIVGYDFHRGVLACGIRKPRRTVQKDFGLPTDERETLVATYGVQDPENLGGILRSCAALGIRRVIIGPGTVDPMARRVLRVSMGNVLRLQIFRSEDLSADLNWLRAHGQIESIATSLDDQAQPLEAFRRRGPALILVGNERYGLPESIRQAADRSVRIDMELGTDSLNVCVAAGIIMHYICRISPSA